MRLELIDMTNQAINRVGPSLLEPPQYRVELTQCAKWITDKSFHQQR
jgi:hypothetical protein